MDFAAKYALSATEALRLWEQFANFFQISLGENREANLAAVSHAFASIPYENLSKVAQFHQLGEVIRKPTPDEVLNSFYRWRTGGTCFALTNTLLSILETLGFEAAPILADRSYGPDTHCAVVVKIHSAWHLVDPGFLITSPRSLTTLPTRFSTPINEIELISSGSTDRVDLRTWRNGNMMYRLTYKTTPVDRVQFEGAWSASFDWDMMRYPVVTSLNQAGQIYLQGNVLQIKDSRKSVRRNISDEELLPILTSTLGISEEWLRREFLPHVSSEFLHGRATKD